MNPVEAPTRLFGPVGACVLYPDPFDVWEMHCTEDGAPMIVEEWSVRPPGEHLPSAADTLDWIAYSCEDSETDEGWHDDLRNALADPEVKAMAQRLINAIAGRITYRMAGDLIATHVVREIDGQLSMEKKS